MYDVVIVGGGLAGLTAAIDLSRFGYDILVFETNPYPHHKVCGEYVSQEVVPYLKGLGVDLEAEGAVKISNFEMSTVDGKKVTTSLAMGGLGISRYAFDYLLYKRANEQGVTFNFAKVVDINFQNDSFQVNCQEKISYKAKIVIGAYGKRSGLDKSLNRDFMTRKHFWLAVKGHYRNDKFPKNLVALHNFEGGYGGLSKTETGDVNFCYLVHYNSFKKYADIQDFNLKVVSKNRYLKEFLGESEPIFEKPLSIAQISFEKKQPIVNHIFMCGDTAGLIHPLCGNGMAMAIHSAKLAAFSIRKYLDNTDFDRLTMEKDYTVSWNRTFRNRLWIGRKLQYVLLNRNWMNAALRTSLLSERLLKSVIARTHGKPIHYD
jgi:flavin-dependent dehydrogenase